MPHCTANFGWYLAKFLIGFAGITYVYIRYLKEVENSCLCSVRNRELIRNKRLGESRNRCDCEMMRTKKYACGCFPVFLSKDKIEETEIGDHCCCTKYEK